jgi:general secretion pathway protein E
MSINKSISVLGAVLEEAQIVSAEQWRHVLAEHDETEKDIGQILEEEGLITAQEVAMLISLREQVPFVDLREHKIEPQALRLLDGETARRFNIMPIAVVNDTLVMAMEDPSDSSTIDSVSALAGMDVQAVKAVSSEILEYIDLNYKKDSDIAKELTRMAEDAAEEASTKQKLGGRGGDLTADSPIARTCDLIIAQATNDRASDVHVEPQEDRLRIRYRIDGILHDAMSLPLDVHLPLVSRFKILSGLNIAEKRKPQDGQLSAKVGDKTVDVRVATTDTVHGEKIVMRILDKSMALLDLTDLGFLADGIEKYRGMLNAPFGMILIAGPTGSGKTTTLYSSINQLNRDERNIMTIEDPVEYRFNDISQIPVNDAAGLSFATGLRALMRLDPDVILVGEIRDHETASIGVQAALTGHLVMSSIHANDTIAALFRLLDLGVEKFLVSSSLVGIVAQRMIRRVCTHCKRPMIASDEERLIYETELRERRREFYYGQGCASCANTGYKGRTGVHEILVMSEELRRMLLNGATPGEIKDVAIEEGMISMWRNGMLKVKQGITTPYELMRTVYSVES